MAPKNTPETTPATAPDHPGSEQITPLDRGWQQSLPGLSTSRRGSEQEPGPVEVGVRAQIQAMQSDRLLTPMHDGRVALAIRAARDVDQSEGIGAPSGRAKLLEVLNGILDGLPEVEVTAPGMLEDVLEAILDGEDDHEDVTA